LVSDEEKAMIRSIADEHGLSIADTVRMLIRRQAKRLPHDQRSQRIEALSWWLEQGGSLRMPSESESYWKERLAGPVDEVAAFLVDRMTAQEFLK
jgi:hypothetical protein